MGHRSELVPSKSILGAVETSFPFFVYFSDADFCNGGNWHRDGQWDINPYGMMNVHEGGHWLELNENTCHIDNIVIECPPGTTQPPIQEDGVWEGGLYAACRRCEQYRDE